jgi:hypothetical protein
MRSNLVLASCLTSALVLAFRILDKDSDLSTMLEIMTYHNRPSAQY